METEEKIIAALVLAALLCGCANQPAEETYPLMEVTSPAFADMEKIPEKYTCDGSDVNPPLSFSGFPNGTKSVALIVDDPDAPLGTWTHWVMWNIPPTAAVAENSTPGVEGINNFGRKRYGGPCPPFGEHRYFFRAYALDAELTLGEAAGKGDVLEAIRGHVLAEGELVGVYSRGG